MRSLLSRILTFALALAVVPAIASAQGTTVSGKVTSPEGMGSPVRGLDPGAGIGRSRGTTGRTRIAVPARAFTGGQQSRSRRGASATSRRARASR